MKSGKLMAIAVILIGSFPVFGQSIDPSLETGIKPFGSFHGGNLDSVNLSNGNLTLHIPLPDYSQRGELSYGIQLTYNSKGWSVNPNCNSVTGVCSPFWLWNGESVSLNSFYGGAGLVSSSWTSADQVFVDWEPSYKGALTVSFTATTTDGSVHQLAHLPGSGMLTIDGSNIWYDGSQQANHQQGLARNSQGIDVTDLKDTNGNFFSFSTSTPATLTDTLGRSLPTPDSFTSTTDFSGCTGPLPIAGASILTFPGFNGGTRLIKFCDADVALQTNFQASASYNSNVTAIAEHAVAATNNPMLQSVVLYNGVSWASSPAWTFEYSSRDSGDSASVNYGDLTKITLPSGGTISYNWGTNDTCSALFESPTAPVSRVVTSRTVNANDGTGPHTWTYSGGEVRDPNGNDTLHTFTGLNGSCSLYETKTQYFQGSSQSGQLLKTVTTDYRFIANPFDNVVPGNQLKTVTQVFPIRTTTTWPSGKVTKIEKDYDSNLVVTAPSQFTGTYGNVIEMREYDYGDATHAPVLVRRTDYGYKAFDGSSTAANYLAFNLVNLVSSVTVYDGSGNQVAKTTYGYDESSLQSSGVATHHDGTLPNPGTRGNSTSVSRWLNSTGGTLTTKTTYYDTGTPYQVTDPAGNVTTNFYATGFQSGASFAGAYVTQAQNALQQNTYFDYDFNTGLHIATKDANGQVASSDYDFLNRILHSNAPDKGLITWVYTDTQPPMVTVTNTITGTQNAIQVGPRTQEADLDGLGRLVTTKLTSDPEGADFVDITYDPLGRVASVSNPHRVTASATDGTTTTQYDALGRVTQVTKQDNSTVTTQYDLTSANSPNGDCTLVTDEAAKARQSCVDGLGRLIEVDEPNAASGSMSNPYITLYGYDVLGNMLSVNQKGDGSQPARVRTFTYDSLSRLLTATNPESGQIIYSYDTNGNVLQKTSPAPNQTGSATQTISYCYDPLNRVTGKAYSAQSCPLTSPVVTYSYDAGTNGIGHSTSLTDQAGSGSYSYDAMGRINSESRTIAGVTKNLAYTYNLDGSVATLTYPSGAVVTYTPDAAGRALSAVDIANKINYVTGSGGPDPASGATYSPDGSLLSFNQGWTTSFDGIANSFSYNSRLQPVNMAAVSPGTTGTSATASVNINGGLNSASSGGGSAPLAQSNTALTSFVDSNGNSHAFYLDVNQHVWHLFWNSSNGWQNQDLTAITTNTPAAGNSSLSAVLDTSGNTHVFYLDSSQHVHELVCCSWQDHDLTAMTGSTLAASGNSLSGAVQASGNPVHLYYLGTNQHVYHLFINGGSWQNQDLTAMAGGSAVAAGSGLSNTLDSSNAAHVFYVDGNQHVNQLYCGVGQCWINQDLTAVTGNTLAAAGTNITSYAVPAGNPVHAYYLGPSEHLYHLYLDTTGNWQNQDLSALTGGPTPVAGTALSSLIDNSGVSGSGAFLRHYYLDASQRVNETVCGVGDCWVDTDLTVLLNTNSAAVGSGLTSFGPSGGNPVHVHYVGPNQHVYHLYLSSSGGWVNQDVSALSSVTLPDSGTVSLTTGGFTATACFGHSSNSACTGLPINNTASQVASALAQALNAAGSPVTASVSGATINMTWKAPGPFTTPISALRTTHDNPSFFPNPSFTSSATNFSGGSGANLAVSNITYDFHVGNGDNGNVYGITNNRDTTRSQTFTYDALNRLISARNAGSDCTKKTANNLFMYWGNTYTYDPWGNLTNKTVMQNVTPPTCAGESLNAPVTANNQFQSAVPCYDASGNLTGITTYCYDVAGNLRSDGTGLIYTYDAENRITGTAGFTYTYDADGNRVKKSNGSTGTIYWYMSPGIVAQSDLSGNLKSEHVFFNGRRVARRDFPSGAVSYYFSDRLRSTSVITDSAGNIKSDIDYYPFGAELDLANNDINPFKYIGVERDAETGLDRMGLRYYSSLLSRFATPDPDQAAGFEYVEDPQAWNGYSYARNNPLRYADPNGDSYNVCDEHGKNCSEQSDGQFDQNKENAQKAGEVWKDGRIFVPDESGNLQFKGTYTDLGRDIAGDPVANRLAASLIVNAFDHGMKEFGKNALFAAGGALVGRAIGAGIKAALAARAAKGGEEVYYLYQKVSATGEHLKFGITKNPSFRLGVANTQGAVSRYTAAEMNGGSLRIVASGTKQEMLTLERNLHSTLPIGPEEGQSAYIQIQINNGLKPPPY